MPGLNLNIPNENLEQRAIDILAQDGSFVVRGCAGSGKSILALKKAEILASEKKSCLVVLFNNTLEAYENVGLKESNMAKNQSFTVKSITKNCYEWEKQENKIVNTGWKAGEYDYIIVDEAQDIADDQLDDFLSHGNNVIFFGDNNQQIYRGLSLDEIVKTTLQKKGVELPEIVLSINYRLPQKVASFANALTAIDPGQCTKSGEQVPFVKGFNSKEEELSAIASLISKRQDLGTVGILFKKNDDVIEAEKILNRIAPNERFEVRKRRENASDDVWAQYDDNTDFATTNPKVMTYHSAKGLEFDTVFLPHFAYFRPSNNIKNYIIGEQAKFWHMPTYVALTRATRLLFVSYNGQIPSCLEWENIRPLYQTWPEECQHIGLNDDNNLVSSDEEMPF